MPSVVDIAASQAISNVHVDRDETSHRRDVPRFQRGISSRFRRDAQLYLAVLLLGVLVFWPSITSSFLLDDHLHASMVEGGFPGRRGPFDLYSFVDDDNRAQLLARGVIPWWSDPALKIRFFRPLSSAWIWASHRLFHHGALAMHLVSFALWAVVVLAAHTTMRRLVGRRAAWLGSFAFAFAPCQVAPLTWIANSEALLCIALGLFALDRHARWVTAPRWRDGALCFVAFFLAMLCGEYSLAFAGYVLGFSLLLPGRAGARERVRSTLPFFVAAAAYLVMRQRYHAGSSGSGFYLDPLGAPLEFIRQSPWRGLTLLLDEWLTLDAETFGARPAAWRVYLVAALAIGFLAPPMAHLLRRMPAERARVVVALLFGSLVALVPMIAVNPSPRVVGISAFGMCAALGAAWEEEWFSPIARPRRGLAEWSSIALVVLGFLHWIHGPITAWLTARSMREETRDFGQQLAWLRARVADPSHADVAFVRGLGRMFFAPFAVAPNGAPPARWRMLALTGHVLALRRDARTLELRVPREDSLIAGGEWSLFRSDQRPLEVGTLVRVEGMTAQVLEVGPRGPTRARFVFDDELDRGARIWLSERAIGFSDVTLPGPGFGAPYDL